MSINSFADQAPRAKAHRRRRHYALAASTGLHFLAFFAMFATASGDIISGTPGGGYGGPAFEVTLVGPLSSAAAQSDSATDAEMQSLFAKLKIAPADNADPVATNASGEFSKMAELLRNRPSDNANEGRDTANRSPQETAEEATNEHARSSRTVQASAVHSGTDSSTGGLAGQIAPCWRELSGNVNEDVTLVVVLDATGHLARAPEILRDSNERPTERRLSAESKALAALAACLPATDRQLVRKRHLLRLGRTERR